MGLTTIISLIREHCQSLDIDHRFFTVSHPKTNGQAELTNRVLLNGLKKKKKEVKEAKLEWVKLLNKTLWAYRTTKKTSTRESPFLLTYESEAMILADIGCPKYMVVYYTSKGNEQGLRANLDLLKKS